MLASRPIRPYSASHASRVRRFALKTHPIKLNSYKRCIGGRRKKRNEPERTARVHFIQRGILVIFHVMRIEVLNCRLVCANEHEMRQEHNHSEYRE